MMTDKPNKSASKLFVTAKKRRHPIGCLFFFCLNNVKGGFEARVLI